MCLEYVYLCVYHTSAHYACMFSVCIYMYIIYLYGLMCEYIVYICMALRVYMYSEFIWLYLAYIFYICMALLCTYILHLHCFSTERGGHLRYEYIYSCQTSTLSSQCHKLYLSHAFNGSFSYIYVYIYIFMRIYTFSKSIYTFM